MKKILMINGPNLNLLGSREPDVYGMDDLKSIENRLTKKAADLNFELGCFQTNAEHEMIEKIHDAKKNNVCFILINPGAFTHTSISVRDALLSVSIPFYEIHLSNTFSREEFRHKSYFSDIASGCIIGFGSHGYELGLIAAIKKIQQS